MLSQELDKLRRRKQEHEKFALDAAQTVSTVGPEVHKLFCELGCQEQSIEQEIMQQQQLMGSIITGQQLMRMLGIIDHQASLVSNLYVSIAGSWVPNNSLWISWRW